MTDNLNLKTTIYISGVPFDFQILNLEDGILKRFILGGNKYTIEKETTGPEPKIDDKPNLIEFKPTRFRVDNWTPAEDQTLINNYKKYTVPRIVKLNLLPNHTASGIYDRANRLNLKKYKKRIKISKIIKNVSKNFNQKILSNKYHNIVYEQCFNHLVFKLETKENFTNKDLKVLLKDWYQNALNLELKKSNINNYLSSYKQYGLDQGFFEKIEPGLYKIPKIAKTIEEKKTGNNQPVRGFTEHVKMRIQEIRDNEKKFEKEHKYETTKETISS